VKVSHLALKCLLLQNSDKDEKPSASVSSHSLDLGFPDDEDDTHPEGKIMRCWFCCFRCSVVIVALVIAVTVKYTCTLLLLFGIIGALKMTLFSCLSHICILYFLYVYMCRYIFLYFYISHSCSVCFGTITKLLLLLLLPIMMVFINLYLLFSVSEYRQHFTVQLD